MTAQQHLLTERDGDVLILRFNRPERLNAMSETMLEQARAAVAEAASDGTRCLLITGMGRAFNAGADLQPSESATPVDLGLFLEQAINPLLQRLATAPFPIVSAVNGAAAGAGAGLALAGDFVVMGRSSYLLLAFANIGLVPDAGLTYLLPRLIGRQRALQMMMLGERILAETCERWGLAYKMVDDDALMEESLALAHRLAAGPTGAYALIRSNVRAALDGSYTDGLQIERETQAGMSATADFKEGVQAFLERRKAVFTGR